MLIQESLKVVRRLASQPEAYDEAQFFLANCYGTGMLGLQVDHERAYHLYLQAAKQNHPSATYRVAVCNEIGAGTRREPPRAAAFYRKAASLGDTAAMYKLGMILLFGTLGESKNPREAINWLKRAAEQADEDNPHALHELGLVYELSQHVVQGLVHGLSRSYSHVGSGAAVLGDPMVALVWLVNELSSLGITLRASQVVTTGACTVPLQVVPGDRVVADFGVLGTASVTFTY